MTKLQQYNYWSARPRKGGWLVVSLSMSTMTIERFPPARHRHARTSLPR